MSSASRSRAITGREGPYTQLTGDGIVSALASFLREWWTKKQSGVAPNHAKQLFRQQYVIFLFFSHAVDPRNVFFACLPVPRRLKRSPDERDHTHSSRGMALSLPLLLSFESDEQKCKLMAAQNRTSQQRQVFFSSTAVVWFTAVNIFLRAYWSLAASNEHHTTTTIDTAHGRWLCRCSCFIRPRVMNKKPNLCELKRL